MSAKVTVMKFGGTSIEDQAAFERVAQIVASDKSARTVVVVSAMSRVTDALLLSLRLAARGDLNPALDSINEHLERHLQVASGLGASARAGATLLIESVRCEISDLLNAVSFSRKTSARMQDRIASYGERLSACLLASVLAEHGLPASYVDARRCITTDEEHGKANPLPRLTTQRTRAELEPLLKAGRVPVLGGFIAATIRGVTTTLGRGSLGLHCDACERGSWCARDSNLDGCQRSVDSRPATYQDGAHGSPALLWRGCRTCTLRGQGAPPENDSTGG